MSETFTTAFLTLFVMVDPIGMAPLFAALTVGASFRERVRTAAIGSLAALAILAVFGLIGDVMLAAFGVSIAAFRVAGGLMLFLVAVEMLFERRTERREKRAEESAGRSDPAIFPLATPLIAGPGAMASMILLTAGEGGWTGQAAVYAALAAVMALVFISCAITDLLERVLGPVGIQVMTRVLGMLLGALAVQFIIDGLADFGVIVIP